MPEPNKFILRLNDKLKSIPSLLENNHTKILWAFIIIYILIFSTFSLYKYFTYNYIGLDLAIYNQAFFNSAQGHLFGLTIHPHSYLGDHFELIIIFLLPFYLIFKNPGTLLILQTVFLGLAAYPLFLLARRKLSVNLSLFLAVFYLTNVFTHNVNSYEFHILPLAIPLFFLLFYFYQKEKFGLFLLILSLSLIVREDVSLVIIAFAFLAFLEKKSLKWVILPLVFGVIWFIFSLKMTGYFSGYGQYKFIRYYGWLGNDLKSVILGALNHPLAVLKHLFSGHNLAFLVGLFLPFGFLPFIKIKYLIPTLLIILQILLLGMAGALALEIHYTSLILPFLIISLIFVFEKIFYQTNKNKLLLFLKKEKNIFLIILFLVGLYSSFYMGPIYFYARDLFDYPKIKEEVKLRDDFVEQIKAGSSVATGFHFIPRLSSREKIYSLHYQYLGKKQYSDSGYRIPADVEYLLFDLNDFHYYHYLYHEDDKNNIKGAERIRQLIKENNFCLNQYLGKFLYYEKDCQNNNEEPNKVIEKMPLAASITDLTFNSIFKLMGQETGALKIESINNHNYRIFPLTLYWQSLVKTKNDYQLKLSLWQNNQIAWQTDYPLAAFYPTHDWQPGEIVQANYKFFLPQYLKTGRYELKIYVLLTEGKMGLSKDKVFRPFIKKQEVIGEITPLWITL